MAALTDLSLTEMKAGLAARMFSAVELTQAHLDAMAANRHLNAFIVETPELALAQARAVDDGTRTGPLAGIPLGIKDLFATQGVQTTAGSAILKGFVPPYESGVTANLLRDGAVFLGKLNMDEFAMGSSNETSAFGKVISPWKARGSDAALVPGGSSGGSAAAVAARLCAGATGTDTGGSIRQPAAFVGIAGIKPTYGRASRWGTIAFASSLDQAGPMARSVSDCAHLLTSMCGFDDRDSTSLDLPVPDFAAGLTGSMTGKRVGIPAEYRLDGMDSEIAALWDQGIAWLRSEGAEIVSVSLPHTRYALPTYYIVAPAEASSNLARYDGVRYGLRDLPDGAGLQDMYAATRAAGFGPEVKRRIMLGTYVLSAGFYDAYYTQAMKLRTLIQRDFTQAFKACDVILAPTTPTAAFALGEKTEDPLAMYLNDVFSVPASLAGLPAMSVPAGLNKDGLPLGLQIIGPAFDEQGVLNAGLAIEQRAGFTAKPEKWW